MSGLRTGAQTVLAPVQRVATSAFSPVGNFLSDVVHLGRTRAQLKKLEGQNAQLRSTLIAHKSQDVDVKSLKSILDLAGTAGYKIVNAKVISQGSATSFSQTVTIDAGANMHITRDMTVICGEGLVGVVKIVYPNSSLVMLASDPSFRVGVRVAGSQQIGILSGQGTDHAVLQLLNSQSSVKVGDALVALGSQANKPFVPGVPVGSVSSLSTSSGAISQIADVKYYAHLNSLAVVAVVVQAPASDPRDALVPKPPVPTPVPTVTIFVTPTPSPSPTK